MKFKLIYPKWPKLARQTEFHLPPHVPVVFAASLPNDVEVAFIDAHTGESLVGVAEGLGDTDAFLNIQADGTTIVLTTHYMDEAHVLCDEIAIMDAGQIIMSGAPDTLLRDRYKGLIIELPIEDLTGDLDGIEYVVYENQGIIEIMSTDVSSSLDALAPRVENLNRMKIRQANLEDLFLDLAGHSLRA